MRAKVAGILADIKQRNHPQRLKHLADFAEKLAKVQQRATHRQMKAALDKLRGHVAEVELLAGDMVQDAKRRRMEEDN